MEEILNIQSPVTFDESISHYEIHAHQPYNVSSYNNSDEIRISVQHQDLCLLPSASSLHVCGRLTKAYGTLVKNTKLVNNAVCHMFEEIRYEINAIEIDKCKNVGLITIMKGWVSINPSQSLIIQNAGWLDVEEKENLMNSERYFDISIPLSMILGFTEDYRKVVINVKHELILTRSRNDLNSVIQTPTKVATVTTAAEYENFKIELMKVEWLMPYVVLSNQHKIRMLSHIQSKLINMSFRSWELYEYPLLPTTPKHVWTVKTPNQLENPCFEILGFQTNRKAAKEINASRFDHCNISNVKLFLNSQYYPYGNLNLDIECNQYAMLYDMYANFQHAYYDKSIEPMLKKQHFINCLPLIVIDCSKQNEALKNASVDVRLEFESKDNFPTGTSAYCLIIHDRIVQYNCANGVVKKTRLIYLITHIDMI
ncbi:uncharacterized protein LOC116416314 [Nasonia vitripennis]|uniref:Double jelly roll-like domain-containing protein n=1 Tax=Nasonia vitripennis TaxID=7425 RepID=A0A7M7Q3A5_NASVI|nr:uncharacterized protein LOC116416314 [Nasonia vitripennis]